MVKSPPLSILGASARAAAASATRAGYAVSAVDLFADSDTRQIASTKRIADYPAEFLSATADWPHAPWMYTGGLENYPDLVDAIASRCPLWGNSGDVLRAVRDPLMWTNTLRAAGFFVPDVSRSFGEVPRDGSWLAKPLRSAGGLHIRVVDMSVEIPLDGSHEVYFQQRVPGMAASAVFVAAGRKATLLGATQQLSGAPWTGAASFLYSGSIGPLALGDDLSAMLMRLGDVLAEAFALTGLFGVDGIVKDGDFWPIEINPRYPASIEILERASGANFLRFHADACQHAALPTLAWSVQRMHGKAILYATHDATFTSAAADWVARMNAAQTWPVVADIPAPGEPLPAGSPVATLFAAGSDMDEVAARLSDRCQQLRAVLASTP